VTAAAQDAAHAAVAVDGIASAAIFLTDPAGPDGGLSFGGAAGISGPPLDGLIAAVANPAHPIRRSVSDPAATFDVRPMNPGGPALRSHLPIRTDDRRTLGVLAVAHGEPLTADARATLEALAAGLATAISNEPKEELA
jgi:GAF domain-containing protein